MMMHLKRGDTEEAWKGVFGVYLDCRRRLGLTERVERLYLIPMNDNIQI